jgi:hypothetical protein
VMSLLVLISHLVELPSTLTARSSIRVIAACRPKGLHLLQHVLGPTSAGLRRYSACSRWCCHFRAIVLRPLVTETVVNCAECSLRCCGCHFNMTALVLSVFPNALFGGSSHTFILYSWLFLFLHPLCLGLCKGGSVRI